MSKNKLYTLLFIACFFGYIWLGYSISHANENGHSGIGLCLFKKVTTIPCPSCGTTRAILLFTKGNFIQALTVNPLGVVVFGLMLVLPLWIALDVILKKQTLFNAYHKTEHLIRIRWIAVVLIILILINWTWNIYKEL